MRGEDDSRPGEGRFRPLVFGPFEFDCRTGELRDAEDSVRLRPLAARALRSLVERRGELVTRDELRRLLWHDTAVEWEAGIHQVIRQIRRALRDDPARPTYIETIPRRGYRFRAEAVTATARVPRTRSRRGGWLHAGFFVGGVVTTLASLVLAVLTACVMLAD